MDDLPDLVPFPLGSPSDADVEQFMAELPAQHNVSIGGAAGAQIWLFCQMPVWKQNADWDVTTTIEHATRDAERECDFNPEAPRYHGIRPLVVLVRDMALNLSFSILTRSATKEAAGLLQELDLGLLVKQRLIQEASKAINNQRTYSVQLVRARL
ncbi:hypothetical protein RI367_003155 [Sorochytrium milnesiophthora]